jgi:hypothetical protein
VEEADRDIARISEEGARTAEHDLWQRLTSSSLDFSRESRRLLSIEEPETFSPSISSAFMGPSPASWRGCWKPSTQTERAQAQIEHRTSHCATSR